MTDWLTLEDRTRFRSGYLPAVKPSPDLERILAIPRRPPVRDSAREGALVEIMNERLRRPDWDTRACRCADLGRPCITSLLPAQAWALYEAGLTHGILGIIGVGHGKTGLDILVSLVVPGIRTAVLLAPPSLRAQFWGDYQAWSQHFRVPSLTMHGGEAQSAMQRDAPTALHFVPFSKLSRPESTSLLESLAPDAFIVDEAHRLRHPESAATKRFMRFFTAYPTTRCFAWSGTLTNASIRDYGHLSAYTLRMQSPLPLNPGTLAEWATAIDPTEDPAPSGALDTLCAPGETVEKGFNRRLTETRGVISTTTGAVDAAINIYDRSVSIPSELKKLLAHLRRPQDEGGWVRPDGEELVDILEVQACARQLACGFYYRWKFPRGEPEDLINEWFAKRKSYFREVREKLKEARVHLDSPKLLENAAERHVADTESDLPRWEAPAYPAWRDIRAQVQPVQDVVWVDDFLVTDAAEWMRKHTGVVWYAYDAFAERLAKASGAPKHGGGPNAGPDIDAEDGSRSILASIKAHGTGRDGLQRKFRTQLMANPPSSGAEWEQILGRLHRIGQVADEVDCHVYRHTPEYVSAVDHAIRKARYIEETLGTYQKLIVANLDFDLDDL